MYARLALTAIAGLLVAGVAFAQSNVSQDRAAKMDRHFSFTDKDGDGFISRDEASQYPALIKHFGVIDSDKDGKLSRDEMQAYRLGKHDKQRTANAQRKPRTSGDDQDDGALTKADADDRVTGTSKNF